MDIVPLLTGLAVFIGAITKLITTLSQLRSFKRSHIIDLQNHLIFRQMREWKNGVIRIKLTSKKKETAVKRLIMTMIDVLNERTSGLVKDITADRKHRPDMIEWHMNTIDLMYEKAKEFGIPSAFIDKFKIWCSDEESCLLEAIKRQADSYHITYLHMVDDVLKDYIILFGLIFNNVERLKDDFIRKLNGELDKLL